MTGTKQMLLITATAVVAAAVTVMALRIFEDEPPVGGAVPATIRSAVLGEDREYFIHLPVGYETDSSHRYPVMYVLDGTSQSGHTAESASLLARVGLIPPMIAVGVPSIDGDTRNRDYTPPDMRLDTDADTSRNGAADRFLSHLETELIPQVERRYRTTRPRLLAGWSRAGLFVVYSQIVAPALFDARFAHSPALWRESDLIVTRFEQAITASALPEGFLYLSLGDQENEKMTAAFQHMVGLLERSAPPTLRWRADLSVRGTHDSNPRLSTPVGLCAMFNADRSCGPSDPATRHKASFSTGDGGMVDKWLGHWNGPEGTYLVLSRRGNQYVVEIKSLDGLATYEGAAAGDRIQFERDGGAESIRAGSGKETGMKWMLEKTDCLIIKEGEGFCRK